MADFDVHNAIHAVVGLGLPTNLVDDSPGHVEHHRIIHSAMDLGLPSIIDTGVSPDHSDWHNLIEGWLAEAFVGPRGLVGQRNPNQIPGYPTAFTSTHSDFTSLQSAVNAGGTNRKFQITQSIALEAPLVPHTGDQFWGVDGVTITRSGSVNPAIGGIAPPSDVKVMNLVFDGFNNSTGTGKGGAGDISVQPHTSHRWEVGYCEFTNTWHGVAQSTLAEDVWVHHCLFTIVGPGIGGFRSRRNIVEDCVFGPDAGDSGIKQVGTSFAKWRHNHFFDCERGSIWYDTSNSSSITEWNLIEDTGDLNPMGGVGYEVNGWVDGTVTGPNIGEQITRATKNICRYNEFRDNHDTGISIFESKFTDIYENSFSQDCINQPNIGTINMRSVDPVSHDVGAICNEELEGNSVHHNHIVQTQANRFAASFTYSGSNPDPWVTLNTKNNRWFANTYDLIDPEVTPQFKWAGVNKVFSAWQAVPQDANGSAV